MAEGQSNAEGYSEVEQKIRVYRTAQKLNQQRKKLKEKINHINQDSREFESKTKRKLDDFSSVEIEKKIKQYKTEGKDQLKKLFDVFNTSVDQSGTTKTTQELVNILTTTTNRSLGRINEIMSTELISALGCSEEQEYETKPIYIKVASLDIFGKTLTTNPDQVPGKYLYENRPFSPRRVPYSFNRELYNRLQQKGVSYNQQYGLNFIGASGQPLFDLKYVTNNGIEDGDFYEVTLSSRVGGAKVGDFIIDYLQSIDVLDINSLYANVLNLITGSVSFKLNWSDETNREQKKIEKFIQRILGLCFDNNQEIDVSGVGKLDPLDQIDESIFILDDIELVEIENDVANILSGVVEFEDCGSVKLPINSDLLLNSLSGFTDPNLSINQYDALVRNMLSDIANNSEWKVRFPTIPWDEIINKEFLNLIPTALVNSLLSPKHLFPLFVMGKSIGQSFQDEIETGQDFFIFYRKFIINFVSKLYAIFVEEMVKEIRKNLRSLIEITVNQQLEEVYNKRNKVLATVLLSINAALTLAAGISDYRRCKSVLDELQGLLQIALRMRSLYTTTGVSPIINYLAFLKPGMSPTSLLSRFIEEMEDIGVPTGDLPSGAPNIGLILTRGFNQSLMDEIAENGKAQVSINLEQLTKLQTGVTPIINLDGNIF
jgi:hypothetical protein